MIIVIYNILIHAYNIQCKETVKEKKRKEKKRKDVQSNTWQRLGPGLEPPLLPVGSPKSIPIEGTGTKAGSLVPDWQSRLENRN
jgi:hypothetical protein